MFLVQMNAEEEHGDLWLASSIVGIIVSLIMLPLGFFVELYVGILHVASIVFSVFSIYYLARPHIKAYLGKS
jgi:hypothetical protein